MQYTISINQQVLSEWPEVDLVDAAIVEYIRLRVIKNRKGLEYHDSGSGGYPYWWVDHRFLTEDMPLLRIGKEALRKRLRNLVRVGLLERYLGKTERSDRTGQLTRKVFYRVHENYNIVEWWYEQLNSFAHTIRKESGQENSKPISKELFEIFVVKVPRPKIQRPVIKGFVDGQARDEQGKFVNVEGGEDVLLPMEELVALGYHRR